MGKCTNLQLLASFLPHPYLSSSLTLCPEGYTMGRDIDIDTDIDTKEKSALK